MCIKAQSNVTVYKHCNYYQQYNDPYDPYNTRKEFIVFGHNKWKLFNKNSLDSFSDDLVF